MNLTNSTYLILGASGGIGSALCQALRAAGANVLAASRSPEKLDTLAAAGILPFPADSTDPAAVEAAVQEAVRRFGRLDGAANCAGSLLLKPAHLTTDAEWMSTIQISLHSSFYLVRSAVKAMGNGPGSIVLVATAAARIGLANHEAIAAAKGGVIGLTLSAAATYGPRNIRVNCVAPGLVETPLTARITGNEASLKASQSMHVLGRIGKPEDVASAMAWLLDPSNSWVTGQVIGVDGGLGTVRSRG